MDELNETVFVAIGSDPIIDREPYWFDQCKFYNTHEEAMVSLQHLYTDRPMGTLFGEPIMFHCKQKFMIFQMTKLEIISRLYKKEITNHITENTLQEMPLEVIRIILNYIPSI